MPERNLTQPEKLTILHQFHQSARQLEEWVELAASVLAATSGNAGVITQPRVADVRLKQLQLVELTETRALLILVTNDGGVHQQTVELPAAAPQEQLTRIANRLNGSFGGKSVNEIAAVESPESLAANESLIVATMTALLLREQQAAVEAPVVEGVREMLRQPEFGHSDRLLDTLEAVDERRLRTNIPSAAVGDGNVAVIIGDENSEGPYQDMSFVLTRYGMPGSAGGLLGVLGPTRMAYGDAVAHVRYVGDVLTELMRRFYGED